MSGGSMSAHGSKRCGQRVTNLQPAGRWWMSGTLPGITVRRSALTPSTRGIEPSSPACTGWSGLRNSSRDRRDLLDLPAVHHRDAVARLGDHREVVRDQENRGAGAPRLQLQHQVQDLRLNRHVQRRRRLVGDEERRVQHERHGDHHALAHAAGEMMRVVLHPRGGVGNADLGEDVDGARVRGLPAARSCARITSVTCMPIVNTGFSEVIGS